MADDAALEARIVAISAELRCLVCQNQTIADSHAELAKDLRRQIREMLVAGKTDREILDFMTQRYGDFVLYRPPFNPATALLWSLRRRSRLAADAFDPDTPEADDDRR